MLVCVPEEIVQNSCCCSPFGCLYLLSNVVNGPHGGWATLEIWKIQFPALFSEVYQRTGIGDKAKETCSMFILTVMTVWVAFRVEDRCFVINLNWVEYTGPCIVHAHLLRNFALISAFTFFFLHTHLEWNILETFNKLWIFYLPSVIIF